MNTKKIINYLTDRNGVSSLLNLYNFYNLREGVDYIQVMITDDIKFRLDKISRKYLNSETFYFIILWINDIYDLNDLDTGRVIRVPTVGFITNLINQIKLERLYD